MTPLVHVDAVSASACDAVVALARGLTGVDSPLNIGHGGSAGAFCTSIRHDHADIRGGEVKKGEQHRPWARFFIPAHTKRPPSSSCKPI